MADDGDKVTMLRALDLAKKSPLKSSNFRVGAVLVRLEDDADGHGVCDNVVSEGYTLECAGNTHAEECCLIKLAARYSTSEEGLTAVMKSPHALYTTMEPCSERLSGKLSCVERVLRQKSWIRKVYVGVQEPQTFVDSNFGRRLLEQGGIEVLCVPGLDQEILAVATAGHVAD